MLKVLILCVLVVGIWAQGGVRQMMPVVGGTSGGELTVSAMSLMDCEKVCSPASMRMCIEDVTRNSRYTGNRYFCADTTKLKLQLQCTSTNDYRRLMEMIQRLVQRNTGGNRGGGGGGGLFDSSLGNLMLLNYWN